MRAPKQGPLFSSPPSAAVPAVAPGPGSKCAARSIQPTLLAFFPSPSGRGNGESTAQRSQRAHGAQRIGDNNGWGELTRRGAAQEDDVEAREQATRACHRPCQQQSSWETWPCSGSARRSMQRQQKGKLRPSSSAVAVAVGTKSVESTTTAGLGRAWRGPGAVRWGFRLRLSWGARTGAAGTDPRPWQPLDKQNHIRNPLRDIAPAHRAHRPGQARKPPGCCPFSSPPSLRHHQASHACQFGQGRACEAVRWRARKRASERRASDRHATGTR